MTPDAAQPVTFRFGVFVLNPKTEELHKDGKLVKLQPQPFKVLALLVGRSGELVTREELREQVWGNETFVDFEHGLNYCIQQIRAALGDDATTPRFIETLPRRGYRFLAPVEKLEPPPLKPSAPPGAPGIPETGTRTLRRPALHGLLAAGLVLLMAAYAGYWHFWRPPASSAQRAILAVLPFENLSGDPEQDYFSDGLTEELITELGRLEPERLWVIARTSAMQYKQGNQDVRRIAGELGADYVLEGSVRREGNRVRVSTQLTQARDQTQLWAVSYEQDLQGVLTLQSEVARAVAREVQLKLTPQQQARLRQAKSVDPEAHEAYLKGLYFWNKFTVEGFQKSISFYQQALDKDPNYAPAYAGLAASYALLGNFRVLPPDEAYPKSKAASAKAIQLDETNSFAHGQLGFVTMFYDRDWAGAERQFQRAIELNPSNGNAREGYCAYFAVTGHLDRALEEIRRARKVDPLSLIINGDLGNTLFLARKYDEALAHLQRTLEMDPNFPPTYFVLSYVYTAKGMYLEANAANLKASLLAQGPQASPWVAEIQKAYNQSGWKGSWQKRVELMLRSQTNGERVPAFSLALAYAHLGDKEKALDWLEKAMAERDYMVTYLKVDPRFDSLRGEPRFQEILRTLRLPP